MSETIFWVVGSGGLLGSHLRRAISQRVPNARFWQSEPPHLSWTKPTKLAEEISHAVATFTAAVCAKRSAWVLLWCAGKGVMSSSAVALEPEWWAWNRLLDLLGHYLAGPLDDLPGEIFLASSVGGVYGGNLGALLTNRRRRDRFLIMVRTSFVWNKPCKTGLRCFPILHVSLAEYRAYMVQGKISTKAKGSFRIFRAV